MFKDFFDISFNNLRRRKLRSWLTMLGIFIGIAAVVSLISLGQGLQTAITGQFSSISTDKLVIQNAGSGLGPPGSTVVEKLTDHDFELINKIPGVKTASPILLRTVKIEFNNKLLFYMMRSIPDDPKKYENYYVTQNIKPQEGRLLKSGDSRKVLLGNNFVTNEDFGKLIRVGKKIKIENIEFEVIGILEPSSEFLLNNAFQIFYDEMKEVLEIGDEIDLIGLQVDSPTIAEETAEKIKKEMRKDRDLKEGKEDFSVQTPLQVIQSVNTILTAINIVVIGIAMISLIVGGIGIANTMYTSVLERKKEIGTMKAIGATNLDILSIFLLEAGLLGLVGGIVGASIGALIAYGISSGANIALGADLFVVDFSMSLILGSISFAFLIGIFSGAIPSYQASKLKPVDALRG
ncbi:MAG: ABC transporter permease [Nanoarchaeota archaeon]|nr:ABC transporter permease [Nanoarchaeota archaeon]